MEAREPIIIQPDRPHTILRSRTEEAPLLSSEERSGRFVLSLRALELLKTERVVSENGRVTFPSPGEMIDVLDDALDLFDGAEIHLDAAFEDLDRVGDSGDGSIHSAAKKVALRGQLGAVQYGSAQSFGLVYDFRSKTPTVTMATGAVVHVCSNLAIWGHDQLRQLPFLAGGEQAVKPFFRDYAERHESEWRAYVDLQGRLRNLRLSPEGFQQLIGQLFEETCQPKNPNSTISISTLTYGVKAITDPANQLYSTEPDGSVTGWTLAGAFSEHTSNKLALNRRWPNTLEVFRTIKEHLLN